MYDVYSCVCVCALDPLITSSLGLCHPKDYFSTLWVIFKYYLKNQTNFATRYPIVTIPNIKNNEVTALFILASVIKSSYVKGFQLLILAKDM